jgi:hypothetical protein
MNTDSLVKIVQGALTDDLRRHPWKGNSNPLAGHCYVASEVIFHLMPGLKPMFIRHEGQPHWFLMNGSEVIDPTASQFETPVPYSMAKGKGFLTKTPSRRARLVMEKIS